ncbi:MAG: Hpt domain-containing protein, partial [Aureliella sp.]
MTIEDIELLAEFVVESQEHLENVESQLLSLEANPDEVDTALVNNVFRAVHSIKGAAGFLGLTTLESLAHREEEVLNRLRNLEIRPTSTVVSTLLAATDKLKGLLSAIESSNAEDVSHHIAALELLLADASASENHKAPALELPTAISHEAQAWLASQPAIGRSHATANPIEPCSGASREAIRAFIIESCDGLEQIDRDLVNLEREPSSTELLNGIFRNIHTIKGSAGFLAYAQLEMVAHAAENLLDKLRSGEMQLTPALINLLFATVDVLRKHLQHIEAHGVEASGLVDGLLAELHAANQSQASAPLAPSQNLRLAQEITVPLS